MGVTKRRVNPELLAAIHAKIDGLIAVGKLPMRVEREGADSGYGLRMIATPEYFWWEGFNGPLTGWVDWINNAVGVEV